MGRLALEERKKHICNKLNYSAQSSSGIEGGISGLDYLRSPGADKSFGAYV